MCVFFVCVCFFFFFFFGGGGLLFSLSKVRVGMEGREGGRGWGGGDVVLEGCCCCFVTGLLLLFRGLLGWCWALLLFLCRLVVFVVWAP